MANDLLQPVPKKALIGIAFLGFLWLWNLAHQTDQRISSPGPSPSTQAEAVPSPYTETAPAPVQPTAKAPAQMKIPTDFGVIKRWSGSGGQKTEPFVIESDMWAVSVTFKTFDPGMSIFTCSAFQPGNDASLPEPVLSTSDPKGARSFVYKSGMFALDINSANCDWIVTLYGEKPK